MVGYPALLDDDDSVSLRIVTNRDLQLRVMRGGVRRLLLLTAAPSVGDAARRLDEGARLAIAASGISLAELAADCRFAAVDAVLDGAELPWDDAAFVALQDERCAHAAGRSPRRRCRALPTCSSPPATCASGSIGSSPTSRRARRSPTPRPTSAGSPGGTS